MYTTDLSTLHNILNANITIILCTQIFKDWELIAITLAVTGVAAFLLFLGSVIPPLRGDVTETNDPEYADGLSVRNP